MDHSDQPVLRDGELLLRPWTTDDVEPSLLLHDAEIARWFDVPATIPTREGHAAWVRGTHAEWADSRSKATFLVEWEGTVAGSVDVRQVAEGVGALSWVVYAPYRSRGIASRAVRLLIDFAFTELGMTRVEAHVNPLNRSSLRVALRAGLRREGLLRANTRLRGEPHDTVVLGRLRSDPTPDTREGFTAMLDSALPVKRAIAQGVLRNERGDVLLCELAYKREWDLPGGVVDPGESPAYCLVREVEEELRITVRPSSLLAVDWLPPWLGWRDAVLLVFDLGTSPSDLADRVVLEHREIRAVHWADEACWSQRVAPYTVRLLRSIGRRDPRVTGALYLEDGNPTLETQPRG
ncbi:NUDIX hydrolase [Intrasporangium sp.]|uniref:NUDIX hydrolase n=1 Tax=Intrasporangium sp. TaxID=1925024 RepID=UPI00293A1919|nr:GNAT family N-acetyltransferase [Intrasporangium sp.]MDV3221209.1 GNAT family N-acetyltransferase [Intrasporangium sp.]